MSFILNPFTGNFDAVGGGGGLAIGSPVSGITQAGGYLYTDASGNLQSDNLLYNTFTGFLGIASNFWGSGVIANGDGTSSQEISISSSALIDPGTSAATVGWAASEATLYDASVVGSILWGQRLAKDSLSAVCHNWGLRELFFTDGNTVAIEYTGVENTGAAISFSGQGVNFNNGLNKINGVSLGGKMGVPGVIATVQAPGQAADITTTNYNQANVAGLYKVHYVLADTTSAVGAGAVILTIAWTDATGATTATATQVLTSTGRQSGTVIVQLASGNITYAVSHTGIFSTAVYALYTWVERIV